MPEKHSQSIQRLTYTAQQRIVCFIKSAVDTAKGRNSSKISSLHSCMLCCMLIELPVLYSHKKWIGFTQASKQTLFDNLPSPWVKNSFTGLSVLYVIFRLVNQLTNLTSELPRVNMGPTANSLSANGDVKNFSGVACNRCAKHCSTGGQNSTGNSGICSSMYSLSYC